MTKSSRTYNLRHYNRVTTISNSLDWTFPLLLAAAVVVLVWTVFAMLGLPTGPIGDPVAARLAWAVGATLFGTVFVFALIQCHVLMFRNGLPEHAMPAAVLTNIAGLALTFTVALLNDWYLGPADMGRLLDATAFSLTGVRMLTAVFDGFACWAAIAIVATSSVILLNRVSTPEELSRQIRASRILLSVGSALLITGVSQSAALHRWPAQEIVLLKQSKCCEDLLADEAKPTDVQAFQATVQSTAMAISTSAGTVCSLVLAAAYLPLGLLLRRRAYDLVKPWERTEAWLTMHSLGLNPTQQLGKVLLMLGPLLASGPVTALLNFISQR